jgi:hypothetical protein
MLVGSLHPHARAARALSAYAGRQKHRGCNFPFIVILSIGRRNLFDRAINAAFCRHRSRKPYRCLFPTGVLHGALGCERPAAVAQFCNLSRRIEKFAGLLEPASSASRWITRPRSFRDHAQISQLCRGSESALHCRRADRASLLWKSSASGFTGISSNHEDAVKRIRVGDRMPKWSSSGAAKCHEGWRSAPREGYRSRTAQNCATSAGVTACA